MDNPQTTTLTFQAEVDLQSTAGQWQACVEPPGTAVYGDTQAVVLDRAKQALDSYASSQIADIGLDGFRRYLDGRGIKSAVTRPGNRNVTVHKTVCVSLPVPAAAD